MDKTTQPGAGGLNYPEESAHAGPLAWGYGGKKAGKKKTRRVAWPRCQKPRWPGRCGGRESRGAQHHLAARPRTCCQEAAMLRAAARPCQPRRGHRGGREVTATAPGAFPWGCPPAGGLRAQGEARRTRCGRGARAHLVRRGRKRRQGAALPKAGRHRRRRVKSVRSLGAGGFKSRLVFSAQIYPGRKRAIKTALFS